MKNFVFGYARVSTEQQNLDRQIAAFKAMGATDRDIITDKESGKDLDRKGYQELKNVLLRPGDTLVVKSLDRLSRNKYDIHNELRYFKENNMFINDAFAQTVGVAATGSTMGVLVQLLLIFIIFYFILIRPQQKKIRAHETMLNAIKKGDKIITGGGICAIVEKVNEDKLDVKIAEGVTVTVYRATVRDVIDEKVVLPTAKAEKTSKNKKK